MNKMIYLQMKHRVRMKRGSIIRLEDIADVLMEGMERDRLRGLVIAADSVNHGKKFKVIDVLSVIDRINEEWPDYTVQVIGPTETIIDFETEKKRVPWLLFTLVWLLLFIGSGMAIMNFHEETSMHQMHQKLYWMMTGERNEYPYLIQIPYSIGLGLGMILFFNHLFKKRINEEPSPLEIEMFNYQQDLDQYVAMNEPKESTKTSDDR